MLERNLPSRLIRGVAYDGAESREIGASSGPFCDKHHIEQQQLTRLAGMLLAL
jgi:hypothetical protein